MADPYTSAARAAQQAAAQEGKYHSDIVQQLLAQGFPDNRPAVVATTAKRDALLKASHSAHALRDRSRRPRAHSSSSGRPRTEQSQRRRASRPALASSGRRMQRGNRNPFNFSFGTTQRQSVSVSQKRPGSAVAASRTTRRTRVAFEADTGSTPAAPSRPRTAGAPSTRAAQLTMDVEALLGARLPLDGRTAPNQTPMPSRRPSTSKAHDILHHMHVHDPPGFLLPPQGSRPTLTTRDVSFLQDERRRTPKKFTSPKVPYTPMGASLPETLIPESDFLEDGSTLPPPLTNQSASRYDTKTRKWVTRVFPSLEPSGRHDVALLEEWVKSKEEVLSNHLERCIAAFDTDQGSAEYISKALLVAKETQNMYSAAFNELVRQVSTHCVDRGRLMARIWKSYIALFVKMLRVVRPLRERIALMEDHVARGQEALRQRTLEMEEERRKQEVLAAEKKGLNIQIQTQQTQLQAQGRDLARLRLRWGSEGTTILDNIADRKLKVELREERFQAETLRENIAVMQTQADELRRIRDGLLKDVEKLNGVVDSRDMELKSVRARGSKLEEELSRAQLVMMAQKEILTALHEAGLIPDSLMKQLEDVISGKTRPSGGHAAQNMSMQQQLHGMLQQCIHNAVGGSGSYGAGGGSGGGGHGLGGEDAQLRMVANAMQQKHVQTALTAELKKVAGQATELISSLKQRDELVNMLLAKLDEAGIPLDGELAKRVGAWKARQEEERKLGLLTPPNDSIRDILDSVAPHTSTIACQTNESGPAAALATSLSGKRPKRVRSVGRLKERSRSSRIRRLASKKSSSSSLFGQSKESKRYRGLHVPAFWVSFMHSMGSAGTIRPWTLSKFRQTIQDCFLEKLKIDADSNSPETQLTPFVCEYFFNKYGVKRLVQLRLKEILSSCRKHGNIEENLRVRFFMRACGITDDDLPPEYLALYLSVLGSVMVDQLHYWGEGEKRWTVTADGLTWIPLRVAVISARRTFAHSPTTMKTCVDAVEALPHLHMTKKVLMKSGAGRGNAPRRASLIAGGVQVNLDVFLDVVMKSWEEDRKEHTKLLESVFQTVDVDGNGMLDIDEFVEAMGMVQGESLNASAAKMLFIRSISNKEEGLIDIGDFVEIAQRHNLKFNVELIRKQQHIAVEGEDDISKEKLEAVTAEVRDLLTEVMEPDSVASALAMAQSAADVIAEATPEDAMEFEELCDTWSHLRPTVASQIASTHQDPATRVLLRHRSLQIDILVQRMRERFIDAGLIERGGIMEEAGVDGLGSEFVTSEDTKLFRDKALEALGELGLGTLHEGTDVAWQKFRQLVKVVQTAVKLQRSRAARSIQAAVRSMLAREYCVRLRFATTLLRRWLVKFRVNRRRRKSQAARMAAASLVDASEACIEEERGHLEATQDTTS